VKTSCGASTGPFSFPLVVYFFRRVQTLNGGFLTRFLKPAREPSTPQNPFPPLTLALVPSMISIAIPPFRVSPPYSFSLFPRAAFLAQVVFPSRIRLPPPSSRQSAFFREFLPFLPARSIAASRSGKTRLPVLAPLLESARRRGTLKSCPSPLRSREPFILACFAAIGAFPSF